MAEGRTADSSTHAGFAVRRRTWSAAAALSVVAALVAGFRASVPSLWSDEIATVTLSTRPYGQLVDFTTHVNDAVHAAYYTAMHLWFDLVGVHAWSVRALSVLAVAASVFGLVLLGTLLVSLRTGILAGVLFTVIPATSWSATEARSYALTAALAVWLAIVFLVTMERRGKWWSVLGASIVLCLTVFAFLALVVLALGVSVVATRRWRPNLRTFLVVAAVAGVAVLPLAYLDVTQRGQIAWIPRLSPSQVPGEFFVHQWFTGWLTYSVGRAPRYGLALIFWSLSAVTVAVAARRANADSPLRPLTALALPWLVLPSAVLFVVTAAGSPIYTEPYVNFSAPALALLAAAGLARVRPTVAAVAVIAVACVLAVPIHRAQRDPYAKATDWGVVAEELAELGQPGDAVYSIDETDTDGYGNRAVLTGYPDEVRGLDDVASTDVFDPLAWGHRVLPLEQVVPRLADHDRLWLLVSPAGDTWDRTPDGAALLGLGYHEESSIPGRYTDLVLLTR